MARFRAWLSRILWDLSWRVGPAHPGYEAETLQGWEFGGYFEATEADAHALFDRVSDATCGVDHHPTEPCPGPAVIVGLHPASLDEDGHPVEPAPVGEGR